MSGPIYNPCKDPMHTHILGVNKEGQVFRVEEVSRKNCLQKIWRWMRSPPTHLSKLRDVFAKYSPSAGDEAVIRHYHNMLLFNQKIRKHNKSELFGSFPCLPLKF